MTGQTERERVMEGWMNEWQDGQTDRQTDTPSHTRFSLRNQLTRTEAGVSGAKIKNGLGFGPKLLEITFFRKNYQQCFISN